MDRRKNFTKIRCTIWHWKRRKNGIFPVENMFDIAPETLVNKLVLIILCLYHLDLGQSQTSYCLTACHASPRYIFDFADLGIFLGFQLFFFFFKSFTEASLYLVINSLLETFSTWPQVFVKIICLIFELASCVVIGDFVWREILKKFLAVGHSKLFIW